jgi:hypothetical protein
MRPAHVCLALAAALSGCTVVPPSAWDFDAMQPRAKTALPAEQLAALSQRVTQLRAERDDIQVRVAGERNVWERQRDYAQLHRVGMQLSPLERQLADATPAR